MSSVPTYVLVPMERSHLEAVLRIERSSHPKPWPEASFRHELEENPFARPIVGVTREGEVVGYCVLWVVFEHAHIQNVAVHPEHRRSGLGRRLLLHALDRARREGADTVQLEVRPSNDAARRLYESLGFRIVRELPAYYSEPPESALRLGRRLEAAAPGV